jgi:hypothetical protein
VHFDFGFVSDLGPQIILVPVGFLLDKKVEVGQHIVLPLDVRHPIEQALEFLWRQRRAEARDSSSYLTSRFRYRLCLASIIHLR